MRHRQSVHIQPGTEVVFTSDTSKKRTTYKVVDVKHDFEEHENLPIRITFATDFDEKGKVVGTTVLGFHENEQLELA